MNPSPERVEAVFAAVLEQSTAAEREACLRELCGADEQLRTRVAALLRAHDHEPSILDISTGCLENTTRPLAVADKTDSVEMKPGDQVGPYQLLQEIGIGGMGVVYMAQQDQPVRRKVAVKIIKPGMDTRQVVARFEAERQALALMDHPNIARVLDAGSTGSGLPYFVMELVQGVSITEYCDQVKLSTRERLQLFISVCHAVQHAHQKGVIHRDIKPTNIMITLHDGRPIPKVIDFGIAKAVDRRLTDKTLFTRYGDLIGTPAYMSPEQAGMSGLDIDTRSDVYSLGALLYELLSGAPPFDSVRLNEVRHDEALEIVREVEPPRPSAMLSTLGARLPAIAEHRKTDPRMLAATIRGELDWIVMKAMEKDRTRRYETAAALALDIQRHLSDEVVSARPPSKIYRLRKLVRRHRMVAAVTALVAAVLLAATAISSHLAWRATQLERLAGQRLEAEGKARRSAEEMHRRALQAEDEARNEAQRASQEAAVSVAVLQFLNQDILGQASPTGRTDRDVMLRTVLDRAAVEVGYRFEEQPAVEAAVQRVLGDTYLALGEYSSAETHLQRSWQLYREQYGSDSAEAVRLANAVAGLYIKRGQFEQAESLANATWLSAKARLGAEHPETIAVRNLIGMLQQLRGHFDQAEAVLQDVLDHRRRLLGENHADTLISMNNLAHAYQAQGRLAKAEPLLTDTLQRIWQHHGSRHPDLITVMNNLAAVYIQQGRLGEAESLFSEALERARRTLGPEHHHTLVIMNSLALNYFHQRRFEEAGELMRKALAAEQRLLGDTHPDTLTTKHNLAALYQDAGRNNEAESLFAETLNQRRRVLGAAHHDTLTTMNNFAYFYLEQGKYAEALPHYRMTAELVPQVFGEDHQNSIVAQALLGLCELELESWESAERELRVALTRCQDLFSDHWWAYCIQSMLGETLMKTGRLEEAERSLLSAYEGLKRQQAGGSARWRHLGLRPTLRRLVEFYSQMQPQPDKADAFRRELEAAGHLES